MNKDKAVSLGKYLNSLKDKLTSPVPPKHVDHPETYHQFLRREISTVQAQLDQHKLDNPTTK